MNKFVFTFNEGGDYKAELTRYINEIISTTRYQVAERKRLISYKLADARRDFAKVTDEMIEKIEADVDVLFKDTLANRQLRMQIIENLTECAPETPDNKQLERLANAILHEELTDNTAWKSRHNEYPIMSDTQIARRREGKHKRKTEGLDREISLSKAETVDATRKDNRIPVRRERSNNENIYMDEAVKSRNADRKKKYSEFTRVQPVTTYFLSDKEMSDRGWV